MANSARADSDDLASNIPSTSKKPASKVLDSAVEEQLSALETEPDAAVSAEATAETGQDALPAALSTAVPEEAADGAAQLSVPVESDAAVSVKAATETEQEPQSTEVDAALPSERSAVIQHAPGPSVPDATVHIESAAAAQACSLDQELKEAEGAATTDLGQNKSQQAAQPDTEASADAIVAAAPVADASLAVESHVDAADASRPQDSFTDTQVLSAVVKILDQPHSPAKADSTAPNHQLPPTAAAAQDPDCISNPLYEERSATQLLEPESRCATQQSASLAGPSAAAGQNMLTLAAADAHSAPLAGSHSQSSQTGASMALVADSTAVPEAAVLTTNTTAVPTTTAATVPTSTVVSAEPVAQSVSAAIPDASREGGLRGVREPTPETVANLGKAVAVVQARSCQLSPSLLTLQNSADMDSPAHDAFEKGD